MFTARVTTACGIAALMLGTLLWWPLWSFHLLVLVAVFFAHAELYRLLLGRRLAYRLTAIAVGLLVALVQIFWSDRVPVDAALVAGLFLIAALYLRYATTFERYPQHVATAAFGLLYISCTLPYLSRLVMLPHGRALVGMVLVAVGLCDTAAYTVGRVWGRRKLAPLCSPQKTWEGWYGGLVGSVCGVFIMRGFFYPEFPLQPALGVGLLIGVVGPLGDLIESALKRAVHVKDSGRMLPGHGGMLDRADAYFFTAPLMYYCARWFV